MTADAVAPESAGRPFRADEIPAFAAILKRRGAEIESNLRGASMRPTIPDGARIRICCTTDPDCRVERIVAFLGGDTLIAHRVVGRGRRRRTSGFLLTRGDATALCDAPVAVTAVLGVVTAWWNGQGWEQPGPPPPATPARRAGRVVAAGLLELHPELARLLSVIAFRLRAFLAHTRRTSS